MRIISFNINGLRARPHQLAALVAQHQPDVIGLQEIKVADEQFPHELVQDLGYQVYFHGQKSHYGVALLCRQAPLQVQKGFPGDGLEAQRRMIWADYPLADGRSVRIMNGYFPQGENRGHPVKFPAKQRFYADLQQFLERDCQPEQPLVLMGDFNISPQDIDIGIGEVNAKRWLRDGKCSFLPEERDWYQRLLGWGLKDSYRQLYTQDTSRYSWFDYRSRGFEDDPKRGLRIDHILISQGLLPSLQGAGIDYEIRSMDKPSDHCPIWADLAL